MLTNFESLDQRVDKFSELVDGNLETLRKAIVDAREVYINVINKSNVEHEERINGLVSDLTNVANSVKDIADNVSTSDSQVE